MPTIQHSYRACCERWWPDQMVGLLVAGLAFYALVYGGQDALLGVGLSERISNTLMQMWFALLAVGGLGMISFSLLDRPCVIAVAAAVIGISLGANCFITIGVNGDSAIGAAIAYGSAGILFIYRAQVSAVVHYERIKAARIALQIVDRRGEHGDG